MKANKIPSTNGGQRSGQSMDCWYLGYILAFESTRYCMSPIHCLESTKLLVHQSAQVPIMSESNVWRDSGPEEGIMVG